MPEELSCKYVSCVHKLTVLEFRWKYIVRFQILDVSRQYASHNYVQICKLVKTEDPIEIIAESVTIITYFRLPPQDAHCDSALVPSSGGPQDELPRGRSQGVPSKPALHQLPSDSAGQLPRRVAGRVAEGRRGQGSRAAERLLPMREGKSAL